MNDIPEAALRTIEDIFGTSFVRHVDGEADAGQLFASVFPENSAQVESLMKLAARYRIPLIARGAGTALYSGRAPRALAVRCAALVPWLPECCHDPCQWSRGRARALQCLPGGEGVLDRACS